MYKITATYNNSIHRYDEFYHITKISYANGFDIISVDEKNFETHKFPFNKGLELYSSTNQYMIYPDNIISLTFEKEPD